MSEKENNSEVVKQIIDSFVAKMREVSSHDRHEIIEGIGETFCMLCGKDEEKEGKCYCAPILRLLRENFKNRN